MKPTNTCRNCTVGPSGVWCVLEGVWWCKFRLPNRRTPVEMFTVGIGLARVKQGLVEEASWTHETDEHLSKIALWVKMVFGVGWKGFGGASFACQTDEHLTKRSWWEWGWLGLNGVWQGGASWTHETDEHLSNMFTGGRGFG